MTLELKTNRLTLRKFNKDDISDIAQAMSDWDVVKWLAVVPHPYSESDAEEFVERRQGDDAPNPKTGFSLAMDLAGEVIGCMAIYTPKEDWGISEPNVLEIGYWVGRPHWGQGYASEAATAALAFATELGVKDVVAGAAIENEASCNVLLKLGFEETGIGEYFCLPQDRVVASRQFRWRARRTIG